MSFKGFGLEKQDMNVTANRNIYVGGSDVPAILGLSKYKTQYELAKEKIGLVKKEFSKNEYTIFGDVLEPQIRDYINAVNGTSFIVNTYIDEDHHIRSNVDGIDLETMTLLEVKTHGVNPDTRVYEAQMQLYMHQIGCDMGWLAMYQRPTDFNTDFDPDNLKIIEVPADKEYQQRILDAIETFWIRCEYLKEDNTMSEQDFMTIGTDMDVAILELNKLAPQILQLKSLEKKEKELKEFVYQKMTENDIKKIETPFLIVTRVLPSKSQRFDSNAFKKDYPDLYDKYMKESERKGFVKFTERKEK